MVVLYFPARQAVHAPPAAVYPGSHRHFVAPGSEVECWVHWIKIERLTYSWLVATAASGAFTRSAPLLRMHLHRRVCKDRALLMNQHARRSQIYVCASQSTCLPPCPAPSVSNWRADLKREVFRPKG
jgi:hypothetical protein